MNPETPVFPEHAHIPFVHEALAWIGITIPSSSSTSRSCWRSPRPTGSGS
jgi:hypothetical protein